MKSMKEQKTMLRPTSSECCHMTVSTYLRCFGFLNGATTSDSIVSKRLLRFEFLSSPCSTHGNIATTPYLSIPFSSTTRCEDVFVTFDVVGIDADDD
jgi:hypothetical protein